MTLPLVVIVVVVVVVVVVVGVAVGVGVRVGAGGVSSNIIYTISSASRSGLFEKFSNTFKYHL